MKKEEGISKPTEERFRLDPPIRDTGGAGGRAMQEPQERGQKSGSEWQHIDAAQPVLQGEQHQSQREEQGKDEEGAALFRGFRPNAAAKGQSKNRPGQGQGEETAVRPGQGHLGEVREEWQGRHGEQGRDMPNLYAQPHQKQGD